MMPNRSWKWVKVVEPTPGASPSFRHFLDAQQYSSDGVAQYEVRRQYNVLHAAAQRFDHVRCITQCSYGAFAAWRVQPSSFCFAHAWFHSQPVMKYTGRCTIVVTHQRFSSSIKAG